MNQLLVSIDLADNNVVRWRVPTAIRGIDVNDSKDIVVTTSSGPVKVEVTPGNYLVEAYLPSGEMLRGSATLEAGKDAAVRLTVPRSPHEWLQSTARMAQSTRLRPASAMSLRPPSTQVDVGCQKLPNPFTALRDWLEQPRRLPPSRPSIEDNVVSRFDISQSTAGAPGKGILVAAFTSSTSSAVALPLDWRKSDFSGDAPFEVVVNKQTGTITTTIQDQQFAPLLGYLSNGESELAARALDETALDILAGKRENPYAAAAGGYVLLHRALQGHEAHLPWREWVGNLNNWFPELPDGWIIRGTLLLNNLRMPNDPPDTDKAALDCFRQVPSRGVPLFADGVRLMMDGLMALSGSVQPPDPALAWVRRLSLCIDRHEPFTTVRIEQTP
jgi:hypothetical protein